MKKIYSVAMLFVMTTATPVLANSIPSLLDLAGGGSIQIYDKIFYDWDVDFMTYNMPDPDISQIDVIPLGDDPLNPGLRFEGNNQFSALAEGNGMDGGEGSVSFAIDYFVSTASGDPLIKDNSLGISAFSYSITGNSVGPDGGEGYISISEDVFEEIEGERGSYIGDKDVNWDDSCILFPENCTLFTEIDFAVQDSILVRTSINIGAEYFFHDDGSTLVNLISFEQRFSQVPSEPIPEPTTMILLGTGLVGVAGAARKKKKNQV